MYFEGTKNGVYVEVALQHNDSYNESVYTFVNNINTIEGGTHLEGFKRSLTKVFNDYARSHNILKDKDGKELVSAKGLISSLNADESKELAISITSNYIDACGYEIVED